MSFIINSFYDCFAAIFTIPAACCNGVYSLFSSTVPQQVARDEQENSQPLTDGRVVNQIPSDQSSVVNAVAGTGLRRRNVPSAQQSTATTQTSMTGGSANRLPVNSSLPQDLSPQSQAEADEMLRLAIENSMQSQGRGSTSTSSSTQPSVIVQAPVNSQNSISLTNSTRQASDMFATAQQRPASSSRSVIPTNLTDDELMALVIANSMKKEEDVYVPQVGNKMPLQNFINGFREGSFSRNKLTALQTLYPTYQPIRGDGNCFYTSFAVDLLASFRNLSQGEKENVLRLVQNCTASGEAKEAVAAGIRRLISGQNFGATDQLMLQFVLCVRHIGADYMGENRDKFLLDAEGILAPLKNMWTMGENTDSGAIRAVVMAFGRPIRIVDYCSNMYYDYSAGGVEEALPSDGDLVPEGPHPERVFLYSGGHYSLLHKS